MTLVYRFSKNLTQGQGSMRHILGGKGAGLAEMCRLGVPVPPGFTVAASACCDYLGDGRKLSQPLRADISQNLKWLEGELGKTLGSPSAPLLLSIRSGARASMPGMMDTILNLGLNDETVEALAAMSKDRRFAFDTYRRFIQMYSSVVLDLDHSEFEQILEHIREAENALEDADISAAGLQEITRQYKAFVLEETGIPFPSNPLDQLWGAISAVFDSWHNPRAIFYRKINQIPEDWGTAVNVQSMVFGNLGDTSATGVCFSRNPATGANEPYGEYLINAQGEDVVAGIRTPYSIQDESDPNCMKTRMPEAYAELMATLKRLEVHFRDMQDTEFTIEEGHLYLLQTRSGKRTSGSGLKIAIDLCTEGMISEREAIAKIDPNSMSQLLASEFDMQAKERILAEGALLGRGLNAGPGAATGRVALSADLAVDWKNRGDDVILVREETSPEDIAGMHSANGILTQRGGMTSHAAVVARGMGKPCVVGCDALQVQAGGKICFGGREVAEGDYISIDGTTGEVILGKIPNQESRLLKDLARGHLQAGSQAAQFCQLMTWVDRHTTMQVRTNADTPGDAKMARILGAKGIGLCRTEHMFFGEDRIFQVRRMILAQDPHVRQDALAHLLPYQTADFLALFREMNGLPVTIRLLDPPLHEFLPHSEELIEELAGAMDMTSNEIHHRIRELQELNPMLGHRGCRLGITQPEIYHMQVSAITGAVQQAKSEGLAVFAEVMVPLITTKAELDFVKNTVQPVIEQAGLDIPVGTMIEIPRAALTADEIAESAAFFSFGTNDLTQCGMGLSRDDSSSFLPGYVERGILPANPFKTLDQRGIGKLVTMASDLGRTTNPQIKLGVCGEHGGDPASISFFFKAGLDYVSCSPYRVPVAKLAAAQASLEGRH